jgi:hypothetical protein
VEVPCRDNSVVFGEDNGVVDDAGELDLNGAPGVCDDVTGRAVNLRSAAHRVGVLDGVVGVAMGRKDR